MKLILKEQTVSVFDMLVHDSDAAYTEIRTSTLCAALNAQLYGIHPGLRLVPPEDSGLDRWIVIVCTQYASEDNAIRFSKRCGSVKKVKDYLPPEVKEALTKLNKLTLKITGDEEE